MLRKMVVQFCSIGQENEFEIDLKIGAMPPYCEK